MTFTPSKETKQNALKSIQVYLGYVRSSLKTSDIMTDYSLQKKGIQINSESAKIISRCLLELEILSKEPNCKCTPDETTGYTDFKDGKGNVCNICGGKVKECTHENYESICDNEGEFLYKVCNDCGESFEENV
jgi:hypothetical protein